jgi:lysophospholipase L1-like esterase
MKRFLPPVTALLHTLFMLWFCAAVAAAPEPLPALFKNAKRVLFLGDSITYDGKYVDAISAYIHLSGKALPPFEIIPCGLSSETVSGLSEPGHANDKFPRPVLRERLERVLTATKPQLVFACYGMNDGIYLPLDEVRFQAFRDGITRLRDAAAKHGATVIHITPPVFDIPPLQNRSDGKTFDYDTVLTAYAAWLIAQRENGWHVIDLHTPMRAAIDSRRAAGDPNFTFSKDKVHPNADGHLLMAKVIWNGILALPEAQPIDSSRDFSALPNPPEALLKPIRERNQLMQRAWLTQTRHLRPGVPAGPPLAEAKAEAAALDSRIAEVLKSLAP